VRDNVTGLAWEKKPKGDGAIGNQGLHDADDRYTWYSTDRYNNGGIRGTANPGKKCFGHVAGKAGTYCNTEAYVNRVNAAGWCGYTDWRLPDRFELRGLVDLSIPWPGPTIDTGYFPDALGTWYWTSSLYASSEYYAWYVLFGHGVSYYSSRYGDSAVRLVRGGQ